MGEPVDQRMAPSRISRLERWRGGSMEEISRMRIFPVIPMHLERFQWPTLVHRIQVDHSSSSTSQTTTFLIGSAQVNLSIQCLGVIEGMAICERISKVRTKNDNPADPIRMNSITIEGL